MLKLTGGHHKNRSLKWLDTPSIRPTPARVREAIFNILASELEGSHWWDLCCGSGVVGLDALSRGAAQVSFIDQNRRSLELLKANLQTLNLKPQSRVYCQDAVRWLRLQKSLAADIIYCDPPYASKVYQPILDSLAQLAPDPAHPSVTLILEHRKDQQNWQLPETWQIADQRQYGDTALAFIRLQP